MNIIDNEKAWSYLYDINTKAENISTLKQQTTDDSIIDLSVHFMVNQYNFLINKNYVDSITAAPKITIIPQQNEYIRGIASIQSSLVVIIDFKYLLLSTPTKLNDKSRVILLNIDNTLIALLVDNICGNLQLNQQLSKYNLTKNPPLEAMSEFVDEAYSYDNSTLYNLNVDQLLTSKKFHPSYTGI
jgi:purine-binding chemotaxis protein CheW